MPADNIKLNKTLLPKVRKIPGSGKSLRGLDGRVYMRDAAFESHTLYDPTTKSGQRDLRKLGII